MNIPELAPSFTAIDSAENDVQGVIKEFLEFASVLPRWKDGSFGDSSVQSFETIQALRVPKMAGIDLATIRPLPNRLLAALQKWHRELGRLRDSLASLSPEEVAAAVAVYPRLADDATLLGKGSA